MVPDVTHASGTTNPAVTMWRCFLTLTMMAALAAQAAAATKWTIFMYLVADNDLECYG